MENSFDVEDPKKSSNHPSSSSEHKYHCSARPRLSRFTNGSAASSVSTLDTPPIKVRAEHYQDLVHRQIAQTTDMLAASSASSSPAAMTPPTSKRDAVSAVQANGKSENEEHPNGSSEADSKLMALYHQLDERELRIARLEAQQRQTLAMNQALSSELEDLRERHAILSPLASKLKQSSFLSDSTKNYLHIQSYEAAHHQSSSLPRNRMNSETLTPGIKPLCNSTAVGDYAVPETEKNVEAISPKKFTNPKYSVDPSPSDIPHQNSEIGSSDYDYHKLYTQESIPKADSKVESDFLLQSDKRDDEYFLSRYDSETRHQMRVTNGVHDRETDDTPRPDPSAVELPNIELNGHDSIPRSYDLNLKQDPDDLGELSRPEVKNRSYNEQKRKDIKEIALEREFEAAMEGFQEEVNALHSTSREDENRFFSSTRDQDAADTSDLLRHELTDLRQQMQELHQQNKILTDEIVSLRSCHERSCSRDSNRAEANGSRCSSDLRTPTNSRSVDTMLTVNTGAQPYARYTELNNPATSTPQLPTSSTVPKDPDTSLSHPALIEQVAATPPQFDRLQRRGSTGSVSSTSTEGILSEADTELQNYRTRIGLASSSTTIPASVARSAKLARYQQQDFMPAVDKTPALSTTASTSSSASSPWSRDELSKSAGLRTVLPRPLVTQHNKGQLGRPRSPLSTAGLRPFIPRFAADVRLQDVVKFSRQGGKIGRGLVKYIGHLPGRGDMYLGIELESQDGKHDGTYNGQRFFSCRHNKGVFVAFNKIVMAWGCGE